MENTATGRGNTEEDGTSGPIEITDTGRGGGIKADGDEDAGQANMSMGRAASIWRSDLCRLSLGTD